MFSQRQARDGNPPDELGILALAGVDALVRPELTSPPALGPGQA